MLFQDEFDWRGCAAVQFDPLKLGGRGTVLNTRMDADGVFENYLDGLTAEEISEAFASDLEAVRTIIAFGVEHGFDQFEPEGVPFPDEYVWQGCAAVEFDPLKIGGRATVGSTRLDADSVFRNYLSGMTLEEFVEEFDADPKLIQQIIDFGLARGYEKAA